MTYLVSIYFNIKVVMVDILILFLTLKGIILIIYIKYDGCYRFHWTLSKSYKVALF